MKKHLFYSLGLILQFTPAMPMMDLTPGTVYHYYAQKYLDRTAKTVVNRGFLFRDSIGESVYDSSCGCNNEGYIYSHPVIYSSTKRINAAGATASLAYLIEDPKNAKSWSIGEPDTTAINAFSLFTTTNGDTLWRCWNTLYAGDPWLTGSVTYARRHDMDFHEKQDMLVNSYKDTLAMQMEYLPDTNPVADGQHRYYRVQVIRGLGVVGVQYSNLNEKINPNGMGSYTTDNLNTLWAQPFPLTEPKGPRFNPYLDSYYLRYITRGADTLYDRDKNKTAVYLPVRGTDKKAVKSWSWTPPTSFLGSNGPTDVVGLLANGSTVPVSWSWDGTRIVLQRETSTRFVRWIAITGAGGNRFVEWGE